MTRVAIVDDHAAMREGLEAVLRGAGLEVVGGAGSAAAGADAVEHGRPDVAVVDAGLPDASGVDLARELLERHPRLAVLLYTDAADAEQLSLALEAGARGYAVKTGSLRELVDAIEHVARGGRYVDPRLDRLLLAERAPGRRARLSPREREVLALMAEGLTADGVAGRLGISVETVRTHVRNVVRKLRARNRVHAIAIALERRDIVLPGDEP